jgi:hypothetical protein
MTRAGLHGQGYASTPILANDPIAGSEGEAGSGGTV